MADPYRTPLPPIQHERLTRMAKWESKSRTLAIEWTARSNHVEIGVWHVPDGPFIVERMHVADVHEMLKILVTAHNEAATDPSGRPGQP